MIKANAVGALSATMLLAVLLAGCGGKRFVVEKEFVNGGTETTVRWASLESDVFDREDASNRAILQYGHKEEPPERIKAPIVTLTKSIKDGKCERVVLAYDEPPPETLIYRLKITNIGSADYQGPLEVVDQLPEEVRYLGIKGVHKRHKVWLPYVGNVETKSKLKVWHVEPPTGGKGTRVRWWADEVEIKKRHWITVDIEFEPPPFDISSEPSG